MSKITFISIFIVPLFLEAQSMQGSLFADHRARDVGDIITVLVVEYTSASSEAKTSTGKQSDHGFMIFGGSKNQAYSPKQGMRGELKNEFDGGGSVSRQGQLRTKVTATVNEVRGNGDLVIQGSRVMDVNGEKGMTSVYGVVRQQDISGDNTVYSYQLAEAQIQYNGKGVVTDGQKPGLLTRMINKVF